MADDREQKLLRYYELAKQSGDKEKQVKALREIKALRSSAPATPAPQQSRTLLQKADAALTATGPGRALAEFAAGVNRGAVDLAEFLTTDQINGIMSAFGSDKRVPNLGTLLPGAAQEGLQGGFMGEGLARDAVRAAGEVVPAAAGSAGLLRSAASALPAATAGEGVLPGALRMLGSEGVGSAAATGATSAAGGVVGGEVGDAIGGDTGRQAGQMIGALAAPLAGGAAAAKLAPNAPNASLPGLQNSRIAEVVQMAGPDSKVAKYVMDGTGKVKSDPLARAAIKQGFDEGLVAAVKGASEKDRDVMRAMLNVMKQGKANARYAAENRPSDVIGQSVVSRFKAVKDANREAGSRLDGIAKSLKGKPVDASNAVSRFLDDLEGMGVKFDGEGRPNFEGSDIEGLQAPEAAIRRMLGRVSKVGGGEMDAYDAHRIKRFIDEQVSFGKSAEGLTGKTENILKSLRRNLDSTLDESFSEYNEVNTKYADTIQALDAFSSVAGRNFDPFSENAAKQAGVLSRRLLSNVQSRAALMDSLSGLQRTAAKYGNEFNDDIITQTMFASELDSIFGPAAKTSLAGEVGKGLRDAAIGGATGTQGVGGAVAGITKGTLNATRGVNEANAIKAMEKLLERSTK